MDSDPKVYLSKNQYGVGILPCNSVCKSKIKVSETSDLQHRKSKAPEKEFDTTIPKRRKRRDRVQQDDQISKFQKIIDSLRKLVMIIVIVMMVTASLYYGYKGLLWLSDWMNEIEVERQRPRYPRI
jgi:NF-X1-type zinc finger protein NFXL1